ncbi:MAG: hypothetical protein IJQ50_06100 [Clostridia bacterium]|nr:hypothetical protein [Clostridia bacterium]
MKKLFNNDTFLKIISFAAAILCWIYIVFITNPQIEVNITGVPITLSDHQSIKNEGYIVSNETTPYIDIKLRGTRSMLANINKDNVLAYVDLSGCNSKGTYEIPVIIKLPYEEVTVISKSVYNVSIVVDKYVSRKFNIKPVYVGELKDENYFLESTDISEPSVTVSGPESIIKTIENVNADINISKASSDFSDTSPIKLLNSNNSEIINKNITLSNTEISYKCTIYKKKEVNIKASVVPIDSAVNYVVTDHPKVTISGPASDVDEIDFISTTEINIKNFNLPHTFNASIIPPKNIKIEENISNVEVLVDNKR